MTGGLKKKWASGLALVLLLCVSVSSWGQTSGSTILGQVKDTSGAVISGAKVEVLATNTGQKRETQSGSDGAFTVPNLPAGPYRVTVTQSGFGGQAKELTLLVGQSADLIFTLSPAAREEEVKVEAEVPLVETNTATIHKNITPEQVQTLPINGRDFSTLAILVPGVTAGNTAINANYDPVKRNVPAISINGQSGRNLFMAIDGGDNTDIFMGGQNLTLSLEAVQEFEVLTHDPKAQYGRGIGGVINVVTKSGTNSFHGSGFGFFRDDSLQSNNAISEMLGDPKPPFDSRQFGGTIGGPIKKDRAFFFYSYERQQNDTSRVFNSGGAFPTLDGTVTPQAFRQNFHLARVDVKVADNHTLFGRYAEQDNGSLNEFFNDQDAPDSTADEFNRFHDVVAGLSSLIGSNKVNDVRFHYQFFSNRIQNDLSSNDVPTIILPAATFGASQAGTQAPKEITYQFSDDFSWTHGRHNIRFGGNVIVQPHIGIEGDFRHNRYRFTTNDYDPATNTILAGNSLANYRSWSSPGFDIVNRTLTHLGFYVQDDIKLGRLTLALGLRYDYVHNLFYNRGTAAEDVVRDNVGAVPGGPSRSTPTDDKNNFAPRVGFAFDVRGNGQFVVRGGYARLFDPASILASTLFADLEVTQVNGNPPFNFVFVPGAFAGFFGIPCATVPCQPAVFDAGPASVPFNFPIGFVNSPDMEVARADQFNLGAAYQIQEGPLAGLTFEADGIYSRTRKLVQGRNLNFCVNADPNCLAGVWTPTGVNFPQAGPNDPITNIPRQIFLEDTTGRNDYTALIVSVRKAFAKRWQLFSSYTLSRAITDTNQFTFVVLNQLQPNAVGELGPTNWDERHRVVISGLVELPWKVQFSNIFTGASARPYTASDSSNCDVNLDGVPTVFGAIDNGPGGSRTQNVSSCDRVGGRGAFRGDPTYSWDIRVAKSFPLESLAPQARIEGIFEVFNLTNAANFGQNFFDDLGDPARFGTPINIITPPRTIQLGVRFRF